jgi:molybdopterin synthase catalytic subunit
LISTTKNTIDQTKIFDQVKDDSCGAIISFTGLVRDHNSKVFFMRPIMKWLKKY